MLATAMIPHGTSKEMTELTVYSIMADVVPLSCERRTRNSFRPGTS